MEATIVTSKGQITIPKEIRQQLGIHKGSKIEFIVVEDHVEMYLVNPPVKLSTSGLACLNRRVQLFRPTLILPLC
jgi:AbrB family looped-hinge helix DNA binding protein